MHIVVCQFCNQYPCKCDRSIPWNDPPHPYSIPSSPWPEPGLKAVTDKIDHACEMLRELSESMDRVGVKIDRTVSKMEAVARSAETLAKDAAVDRDRRGEDAAAQIKALEHRAKVAEDHADRLADSLDAMWRLAVTVARSRTVDILGHGNETHHDAMIPIEMVREALGGREDYERIASYGARIDEYWRRV